jgi:hypothetical protein
MSLSKAIKFVRLAAAEEKHREICYKIQSKNDLLAILGFSEEEFDNAINMRLVQCFTHEDAAAIQELRFWFSML